MIPNPYIIGAVLLAFASVSGYAYTQHQAAQIADLKRDQAEQERDRIGTQYANLARNLALTNKVLTERQDELDTLRRQSNHAKDVIHADQSECGRTVVPAAIRGLFVALPETANDH